MEKMTYKDFVKTKPIVVPFKVGELPTYEEFKNEMDKAFEKLKEDLQKQTNSNR